MGNPVAAALASAHKALDSATKFSSDVTHQAGNKTDPTAPKPAAAKSDYSHAREARKGEGEFMGQSSNAASELNAALDKRAEAKKALE